MLKEYTENVRKKSPLVQQPLRSAFTVNDMHMLIHQHYFRAESDMADKQKRV